MTKNVLVPEGYKKTELGVIPEEWKVVKLEDCCNKITDGSHYSPKSVEKSDYKIATIANINNNEFDLKSCKNISIDEYEKLVKNGCKPNIGDVLFSKDGTVGLCLVYKQEASLVLLSSIAIIPPKKETLNSDFCAHMLKSDLILNDIIGRKTGTAIRRVVLRDLKTVKVPLPSLPEQQKIASVLSKVDEQIEQTEQIIEKTEILKKGLMQKLLTKGIGHTKFKKTELGEIPEEWDIVKLSKIFKNGPQNGLYKHKSHYGKGHKIVELKDLYKSDFYLDTSDLSLIDLTDKEKLTYELFENDVLINRVSKQIEGVAKVLLAKNIKNIIVFESNMMRASLKESLIIPEFFLHYTSSDFYRLQVNNFAKTGNQSSISQGDLNNIKIFITTIEEQQKIAFILSKVDSHIQDNQRYLHKLQELKKGLMQDLLTGKVRVCV